MKSVERLLKRGEPLASHTTFGIGGPAELFGEPEDGEQLLAMVDFARDRGLPIFVLGGGSDTLFPDEGYPGLVLSLRKFQGVAVEGEMVIAEAGVSLKGLVRIALEHGLAGLEPLVGVPGRLGGAVAKNAGAHGAEIKDLLVAGEVLDWTGVVRRFEWHDFQFRYRGSALPQRGLLLRAWLRLHPDDPEAIRERIRAFEDYRKRTQPVGKTAGCMFKNPPGAPYPAGKMIDLAGLKGFRVGDAEVSRIHANFFINRGRARAAEVLELMDVVRDKVQERFGVMLEPEIVIIRP